MRFALTRVGVLLAGCGAHDGSHPAESLLTLLELEKAGVKPVPLAPAGTQMHVMDHATGHEVDAEPREILVESARLSHLKVEVLEESPPERLHALIVPGGGGVPKNLMTGFLQRGVRREPHPPVAALLRHCLDAGKPIGLMGLANFLLDGLVDSPVLPARAGSEPEPLVVDRENRLVYAPAFLSSGSLAEVSGPVHGLVDLVLHFAAEARGLTGTPS